MSKAAANTHTERVTLFQKFATILDHPSLQSILDRIGSDEWANAIQQINRAAEAGKKDYANVLKSKLLAFTPSGTFAERRVAAELQSYSQIIVLDYDKLSPSDVDILHRRAQAIPYTRCVFVSPSGRGLKVLVRVDSAAQDHKIAFANLSAYYGLLLGCKADPSGKDITRLCFVSHDPKLYSNPTAETFSVQAPAQPTAPMPMIEGPAIPKPPTFVQPMKAQSSPDKKATDGTSLDIFLREMQAEGKRYEAGNRNNFLFELAARANREGILQDTLTTWAAEHCADLPAAERHQIIRGTYERYAEQFDSQSNPDFDSVILNAPTFPDGLFADLPPILREACGRLYQQGDGFERERDIMLLGGLTVLSSMLPEVHSNYHQKSQFCNLFSFVVAPPANGKGTINHARWLAVPLHEEFLKSYHQAYLEWEDTIEKEQQSKKSASKTTPPPKRKLHIIPATNTTANIYQQLHINKGHGLIIDTEADTLTGSIKSDKGRDISQMMRKAAEFEWLDKAIKTDNEYSRTIPRLSIALCGTPQQVGRLIDSTEDGLFSRILFYLFRQPIVWRAIGPSSRVSHREFYTALGQRAFRIYQLCLHHPLYFEFTEAQYARFNAGFEEKLRRCTAFYGSELEGTVKRLGALFVRIAMTLTALDHYEQLLRQPQEQPPTDNAEIPRLVCTDPLFDATEHIISTCLEHALIALQLLPQHTKANQNTGIKTRATRREQIYELLPKGRHISVVDATKILQGKVVLSERTLYRYLNQYCASGMARKIGKFYELV